MTSAELEQLSRDVAEKYGINPDNVTISREEYEKLKTNAERWNFVMNDANYCMALFAAVPKDIHDRHRHINNAIDEVRASMSDLIVVSRETIESLLYQDVNEIKADLRALLDKAKTVSGEAVVSNKAILIDTDSNEFLMDSMRIWNEYSSAYRDSGDDGVNRSKALKKGVIEGIKLAIEKYNLNAASPQPADKTEEFRRGAKAMFDYVLYATANNWHGNPELNKKCDAENDFTNKLIVNALAEVSPEDELKWKNIVKLQQEINKLKSQPAEQYEYIGTVNGIGQVVITLEQDGKVKVGEKLYRLNESMKGNYDN